MGADVLCMDDIEYFTRFAANQTGEQSVLEIILISELMMKRTMNIMKSKLFAL